MQAEEKPKIAERNSVTVTEDNASRVGDEREVLPRKTFKRVEFDKLLEPDCEVSAFINFESDQTCRAFFSTKIVSV